MIVYVNVLILLSMPRKFPIGDFFEEKFKLTYWQVLEIFAK